jgi:hypothetical protein
MAGELEAVHRPHASPTFDPSKVSVRKRLPNTPGRGFNWRTQIAKFLPDRDEHARPRDASYDADDSRLLFLCQLVAQRKADQIDYAREVAGWLAQHGRALKLLGLPLSCQCLEKEALTNHEGQCGVLAILKLEEHTRRLGVTPKLVGITAKSAEDMIRRGVVKP